LAGKQEFESCYPDSDEFETQEDYKDWKKGNHAQYAHYEPQLEWQLRSHEEAILWLERCIKYVKANNLSCDRTQMFIRNDNGLFVCIKLYPDRNVNPPNNNPSDPPQNTSDPAPVTIDQLKKPTSKPASMNPSTKKASTSKEEAAAPPAEPVRYQNPRPPQ
jgi:hypothetical protein